MIDLTKEITIQTTRSGGKGGQNVNKVETAVIASLHIEGSQLLSGDQKAILREKLSNRTTADGYLQVKAQTHRTQLANKEEAIEKINKLVNAVVKSEKKFKDLQDQKAELEKKLQKNAEDIENQQKQIESQRAALEGLKGKRKIASN